MTGHEAERADQAGVCNLVRADLTLNHIVPGKVEISHFARLIL
jgi:hypothetical protein